MASLISCLVTCSFFDKRWPRIFYHRLKRAASVSCTRRRRILGCAPIDDESRESFEDTVEAWRAFYSTSPPPSSVRALSTVLSSTSKIAVVLENKMV